MVDWETIFNGWTPVFRTLVLGVSAYIALVVLLRISGKRTLSKMNAFDFVVTVALGSTLASILTSKSVSLVQGVVALGLLILLQLVNTFAAVRWPWFQRLIKSEPTLLFFRGRYLDDALRTHRVTRDEILAAIRGQGVTDPSTVGAIIMETEGSLTVLSDGSIQTDDLRGLGVEDAERQLRAETDTRERDTVGRVNESEVGIK